MNDTGKVGYVGHLASRTYDPAALRRALLAASLLTAALAVQDEGDFVAVAPEPPPDMAVASPSFASPVPRVTRQQRRAKERAGRKKRAQARRVR